MPPQQPNDLRAGTGTPITLDDADKIQRLIVAPMIRTVETRLEEHMGPIKESQVRIEAMVTGHEARMTKIEGQQKKALLGWGAYCFVVSAFFGWLIYVGLDWLKARLRGQ